MTTGWKEMLPWQALFAEQLWLEKCGLPHTNLAEVWREAPLHQPLPGSGSTGNLAEEACGLLLPGSRSFGSREKFDALGTACRSSVQMCLFDSHIRGCGRQTGARGFS